MNKAELLKSLEQEGQNWLALLEQVGPARMEIPGVNGDWTMKDIVAHLTGWNRWHVSCMRAAARGEAGPPPPWPSDLQGDDEINAWIYDSHRNRSVEQVMDETHQSFQELRDVLESLPDDVRIAEKRHLVRLGDQDFAAGDFFDHFHDDHEADVRAWLARIAKG